MRRTEASTLDTRTRWRRIIWNCKADRGVLLYRYYLLDTRWFGIYLHRLMTSDEDRALHDHPWSFVTWLIGGGYWEVIPHSRTGGNIRHWRRRFSVLYRPAEWAHRLELARPTWTLVCRWRTRRIWGFFLPDGWTDYRAYGKQFCD